MLALRSKVKRTPSTTPAAQAKAAARTRPATAAPAVASGTNSVAERARKREFEHDFTKIRKQETAYGVMGSVSNLLTQMETPAAKRAKPTVGERASSLVTDLELASEFIWSVGGVPCPHRGRPERIRGQQSCSR